MATNTDVVVRVAPDTVATRCALACETAGGLRFVRQQAQGIWVARFVWGAPRDLRTRDGGGTLVLTTDLRST